MLAGVVPLRTVLLVVAADEGWSAQTAEHVEALDALGIRRGLVVVTKVDLTAPGAVVADVGVRLAGTSLAGLPVLPVSARTGEGMDALVAALERLEVPEAPDERARLWVDRVFTVRGAGTVVTGTLASGRFSSGDAVLVGGRPGRVRRLESLGSVVEEASGPARVAVNLRDLDPGDLHRGEALVHPGAWWDTRLVDVAADRNLDPPTHAVLHIGSGAVPVRVRPLGPRLLRLAVDTAVPLSVGDRAVLRDPGQRVVVAGVTVLDPDPPALRGRGSAARRATDLADDPTGLAGAVRRRGVLAVDHARRLGLPDEGAPVVRVGDQLVDPALLVRLSADLRASAQQARAADPTDPGPPLAAVAHEHALPLEVVIGAATRAGLDTATGRLALPAAADLGPHEPAVRALEQRLAADPYDAPTRPEASPTSASTSGCSPPPSAPAGSSAPPPTSSSGRVPSRRPSAGSPPSTSRGPSRRPGSPSGPPAGSPSRSAPTSTGAGSPAASPTTAAPSADPLIAEDPPRRLRSGPSEVGHPQSVARGEERVSGRPPSAGRSRCGRRPWRPSRRRPHRRARRRSGPTARGSRRARPRRGAPRHPRRGPRRSAGG